MTPRMPPGERNGAPIQSSSASDRTHDGRARAARRNRQRQQVAALRDRGQRPLTGRQYAERGPGFGVESHVRRQIEGPAVSAQQVDRPDLTGETRADLGQRRLKDRVKRGRRADDRQHRVTNSNLRLVTFMPGKWVELRQRSDHLYSTHRRAQSERIENGERAVRSRIRSIGSAGDYWLPQSSDHRM